MRKGSKHSPEAMEKIRAAHPVTDIRIRLKARSVRVPTTGCILWLGPLQNGYGSLEVQGRKMLVHRVAYETVRGAIGVGLTIDHLCRVRNCINPEHMEAVSSGENTRRGTGVAAHNRRKTRCLRGHLLEGYNLMIVGGARRACRICRNASKLRSYHRAKDTEL